MEYMGTDEGRLVHVGVGTYRCSLSIVSVFSVK